MKHLKVNNKPTKDIIIEESLQQTLIEEATH